MTNLTLTSPRKAPQVAGLVAARRWQACRADGDRTLADDRTALAPMLCGTGIRVGLVAQMAAGFPDRC